MQQQSKPSHSMHRVLPVASAGLTMLSNVDDAALPGPLRLTTVEFEEPQAIFFIYFFFLTFIDVNCRPNLWMGGMMM
ncbi:hypothetical protein F4860DRAFT_476383 [Xylaria cubensis]|nr:hypothetical protein F4860DRAFT_476383 [Xylaria cubensis]